jgi:hypothetical protein
MDNDQETDEFMRRLVAAAPGLSEEQIESIRRVVASPEPAGFVSRGDGDRSRRTR